MPYPLTSRRLLIEPLTKADIAAFVAYRQDPDVARWQSWQPTYAEVEAAQLIENQPSGELPDSGRWIQLAVRDIESGLLHGDVAIHVVGDQPGTFELGVTLSPASQGRGIGTEALARLLRYLFIEARAHRVVAFCDTRNEAAARLLRRVGLRHEARQIEAEYFKGEWASLDGFALLEREYQLAAPAHGVAGNPGLQFGGIR